MPTARSDADMVLAKHDGTSAISLMLVRRAGSALYVAHRLPVLPEQSLRVRQASWHEGFGGYLYRPSDPFRYAYTDGVDLRHANGAQLVNQFEGPLDFLIRNMDAEDSTVAPWTLDLIEHGEHGGDNDGSIANLISGAGTAREGSRSWQCATGTTANSGIYQDLDNPLSFRKVGTSITFRVWVKADSATVQAFIWNDTSGTDNIQTDAHTGGDTYELLSVTATFSNNVSFIAVGVRDTSATSHAVYVDGGWIEPESGVFPTAMVEYAGAFYLACGNMICVWDESKDLWDAVFVRAGSSIYAGLVVHGGFIYGFHDNHRYDYSSDTSDPRSSWTEVTPDNGRADIMMQGLDAEGVLRLFRVDKPNELYVSTETFGNAVGASDWITTPHTVGDTDKNITALFDAFDTIIIGRENGLWYFYPPDDEFRSATEQYKLAQSSENFERGIQYIDGYLYLSTARFGLTRLIFSGGEPVFEVVDPRYGARMYDQFGGRVRALTHDGVWLYALQDTPVVDTSSAKTVNLMAARWEQTSTGQRLVWHTLKNLVMGDIRGLTVEAGFLWAFGRYASDSSNYEMKMYRMALPTKHDNMMKEAIVKVHSSGGTMVTEIFDYDEMGFGEDDKGHIRVRVFAENLSSDLTITVERQADANISDAGSWTGVGSAITSGPSATVSYTAGSSSKRERLRFSFATNVTTSSPILRSFRLESVAHPDRYWQWDFTIQMGSGMRGLGGQRSSDTAQNMMDLVENTLDDEDYPLDFVDVDGQSYSVQILTMDKLVVPKTGAPPAGGTSGERLDRGLRMVIREVLTS